jgi:23S rRNA pseudouridine1911/1915/1917 synthase
MALLFQATGADAGQRLDHFLAAQLAEYSRSRIQSWIEGGRATVDGAPMTKPSFKLRGHESVAVEPLALEPLHAFAENIPLDIVYSDADVIAVNKPAGLVVHAGAGNHSGTLVNALLHHFQTLSGVGGELRPGIVHRIDKGTSGLLLVARTDAAHRHLAAQFSGRTVEKTYLALVQGSPRGDTAAIDLPIARDPAHRTRMTARLGTGRVAHTAYKVVERFPHCALLEVHIGTGRTHQIRVHLAAAGYPIVGDTLYGAAAQPTLDRPWLHAWRIAFDSPSTGERICLEAPLAPELAAWLRRLHH